jgi:hypothetical protein
VYPTKKTRPHTRQGTTLSGPYFTSAHTFSLSLSFPFTDIMSGRLLCLPLSISLRVVLLSRKKRRRWSDENYWGSKGHSDRHCTTAGRWYVRLGHRRAAIDQRRRRQPARWGRPCPSHLNSDPPAGKTVVRPALPAARKTTTAFPSYLSVCIHLHLSNILVRWLRLQWHTATAVLLIQE